jgi:hypothetical protein
VQSGRPHVRFRDIAHADYLVDVYAEAHDAYEDFQRTGRAEFVQRSAAILCDGLSRLENDQAAWHGFRSLARVPPREREVVFEVLEDVDTLLAFEATTLGEEHPLTDLQRDCLRQVGKVTADFREWPDEHATDALRRTVSQSRQRACARASWGTTDRPTRRVSPVVRRGLRVAGGVAIAAANASAAVHGGNPWEAAGSIVSGFDIARHNRGGRS